MKKNLVIIGAGFAGRHTYMSLPTKVKEQCNITIIDQHNYFLFTPLLHEVATGGLDPHDVIEPIHHFIKPGTKFIEDRVLRINHDTKMISLTSHEPIPYDYLVMGLGSKTNFFETPGAEQRSFVLKNLEDAMLLRNRFSTLFQQASELSDAQEQRKLLSLVIIGGGPTGVELAAEAAHLFFKSFKKTFNGKINTSLASITLVNGGKHLLNPFSPSSQKYAQEVLQKKGVKVLNSVRVVEVNKKGAITTEGDCIEGSTIVWAAGVMPEIVDTEVPVAHDRHRLKVNNALQLEGFEDVFVLGDMALAPTEDQRGYPMLAQVAKQQGIQTAKNIEYILQGKPVEPFVFHKKGSLVSLGHAHAIAEMGNLTFYGLFSWIVWRGIYLVTFNSWSNRYKIFSTWFADLFTTRDVTKI